MNYAIYTAAAAVLFAGFGCADLTDIRANGICGNNVVEGLAGEDCDGFDIGRFQCGKPNTALACRVVCESDSRACPNGWTCGADNSCQALTDEYVYQRDLDITAGPGARVIGGDVDGDGVGDVSVVEQGEFRVHFMSLDQSIKSTWSARIGRASGSLVAEDIQGDGTQDFIFPTAEGPAIYSGGQPPTEVQFPLLAGIEKKPGDGATSFTSVPSYLPPLRELHVGRLEERGYCFGALGFKLCPNNDCCVAGTDVDGSVPPTVVELTDRGWSLASVTSPGATSVVVSEQRCIEAGCQTTPRKIDFNGFATGASGFADVNIDGRLDVWVAAPTGLLVGFQNNAGSFCASPAGVNCGTEGLARFDIPSLTTGDILAVFDYNQDGVIDLVRSTGIEVGVPLPNNFVTGLVAEPRGVEEWTTVVINDFNGDGLLDLAGAGLGVPVLDFYLNSGTTFFNANSLVLDTVVAGPLVSGDFDGDLYADVALYAPDWSIRVAYSDGRGVPNLVVPFTSFGVPIASFAASQIGILTGDSVFGLDAVADLIVGVDGADLGAPGFAALGVLRGTTDRRLIAPPTFNLETGQQLQCVKVPSVVLPLTETANRDAPTISTGNDLVVVAARCSGEGENVFVDRPPVVFMSRLNQGLVDVGNETASFTRPAAIDLRRCGVAANVSTFHGVVVNADAGQITMAIEEAQVPRRFEGPSNNVAVYRSEGPLVVTVPRPGPAEEVIRGEFLDCLRLPGPDDRLGAASVERFDVNRDGLSDLVVHYQQADEVGALLAQEVRIYIAPFDENTQPRRLVDTDGQPITQLKLQTVKASDGVEALMLAGRGLFSISSVSLEDPDLVRVSGGRIVTTFIPDVTDLPVGVGIGGVPDIEALDYELHDFDGDGRSEIVVRDQFGFSLFAPRPCTAVLAATGDCVRPSLADDGDLE